MVPTHGTKRKRGPQKIQIKNLTKVMGFWRKEKTFFNKLLLFLRDSYIFARVQELNSNLLR
ncbi:MAG: hypothetical protein A2017_16440 [Lentisphaerae bacterium GWF2_44_16]|nr:MAG: hypothetical protein A2017_16440 [Lentisphaerae bacterium GWF2_44_16]